MPKKTAVVFLLLGLSLPYFAAMPLFADIRSFDAVFPRLPPEIRSAAFSEAGYIKASNKTAGFALIGAGNLEQETRNAVLDNKPGFLVEALKVIPGKPGSVSLLDVYNALGNIQGLKGRLYHSFTKNEDIPLFEDAVRLESAKKAVPVPDPRPASTIPRTETVYIRLKDVNFGNSYYRGDMALGTYSLSYRLSNNKNLTYLFVPVIKEGKFISQFYFEIIEEGVLIYSLAGADVSDFISSKIDMPSALSKRLAVIISWIADGTGKARATLNKSQQMRELASQTTNNA